MARPKQQGAQVVCVAASTYELPVEVQQWLSRANNHIITSPNIYDALALLATENKPAAILVAIDAVDWNEMDFFDHVARTSRETHIYVIGHNHHREKIEAACTRGARLFDADALDDDLHRSLTPATPAGPGGLLAGSLRPAQPVKTPSPKLSQPAAATKPINIESETLEPPSIRLVTTEKFEQEHTERPVPFPWAPSADRPQRTPPKAPFQPGSLPAAGEAESARRIKPASLELTAEEFDALLGNPANRQSNSAKEQGQ